MASATTALLVYDGKFEKSLSNCGHFAGCPFVECMRAFAVLLLHSAPFFGDDGSPDRYPHSKRKVSVQYLSALRQVSAVTRIRRPSTCRVPLSVSWLLISAV